MLRSNASQLAAKRHHHQSIRRRLADEIGRVIEVIQDIAEQTNLLAECDDRSLRQPAMPAKCRRGGHRSQGIGQTNH